MRGGGRRQATAGAEAAVVRVALAGAVVVRGSSAPGENCWYIYCSSSFKTSISP